MAKKFLTMADPTLKPSGWFDVVLLVPHSQESNYRLGYGAFHCSLTNNTWLYVGFIGVYAHHMKDM